MFQDSQSLSHNVFNLISSMNTPMQDVTFGNTAGNFAVTSGPEMVSSVFLDSTRFVRPTSKELTNLFSHCTRWSVIWIPPRPPSCPTGWKSQNGWHSIQTNSTFKETWEVISHHHHHHHHWLDSPWWALAILKSFAHSSLLRATSFQFLTPNILVSWSTPSSHRNFGHPTLLSPSGLVLNIFLRVLSLFIRTKCPAHASLLTLI